MTKLKSIAVHTMFATILSQPIIAVAQTQAQHREAQREQDAHDKRHHNTAKVVGGSAAGGAVVGGLMGGGKGALIGGAVGAGGGVVADKVRKHNGVKKRERQENSYYQKTPTDRSKFILPESGESCGRAAHGTAAHRRAHPY